MCVWWRLPMSIWHKRLQKDVSVKIYITGWIRCLSKYRLCVNVVTMYFCCSVSFPQTLQRNTGCLLFSWRRMRRKSCWLTRGPETCVSWRTSPSKYLSLKPTGRSLLLSCRIIFLHKIRNVFPRWWERVRVKALRANGRFFIPFCSICARKWRSWRRWCTTWWRNVPDRWGR